MALNDSSLASLNETAYGPVRFISSGGNHSGVFDGRTATIAADGAAFCVSLAVAVPWPAAGDIADADRRIAAALALAGALRTELVTLRGDRASASVTVRLWIDAERSDARDLANAVRVCTLLGDVAWRAVDQVGMGLLTEGRLAQETLDARARLEEAQRTLRRLGPLGVPEEMPPTPGPPPGYEAPPAQAPASRFCTKCGAPNASGGGFCTGCGQPLARG